MRDLCLPTPCPLQWRRGVSTTGWPGKPPQPSFKGHFPDYVMGLRVKSASTGLRVHNQGWSGTGSWLVSPPCEQVAGTPASLLLQEQVRGVLRGPRV